MITRWYSLKKSKNQDEYEWDFLYFNTQVGKSNQMDK